MKVKKLYLFLFIVFLYFSGTTISFKTKDFKDNLNILPELSAANSYVYEWNRTWGGVDGDYGHAVAVDSSDNMYLAGITNSFGEGYSDMVLVKYDSSGVQQWNRTWGGSDFDDGYAIAVDSSGNVYLAGNTYGFGAGNSDLVLVKYDSSGMQQWNRTWGGSDFDYGDGIAVDSSGNVYLAGSTKSFAVGSSDMVFVKYESSGVQHWNRTWGGSSGDSGNAVAVDSLDNVYVVGGTSSFGDIYGDMVLVKYNGSGVQQWNRTWGGSDYDNGYGIEVDSSHNIYLVGITDTIPGVGGWDMVLVKYDSSGIWQWTREWGWGDYDEGRGVAIDSSENIYVVGTTNNMFLTRNDDMFLLKYDSSGVLQWYRTWGGALDDYGKGITIDSLDNIYLGGYTYSFGAGLMFLVKYAPDTVKPVINIHKPTQDEKLGDQSPDYNISIVEENLESMWYTIDNGTNNYTIYQLTGIINQTAWDAAPYGNLMIKFYAKDLAGNVGNNEVIVEKVKEEEEEPKILGYQLLLFISLISIVTIIYLKKHYNKFSFS